MWCGLVVCVVSSSVGGAVAAVISALLGHYQGAVGRGVSILHLFTTTVSRWRRVKNLSRERRRSELPRRSQAAARFFQNPLRRSSAASYRIVFTMKRTITARPTHPHITPMTMEVTSPGGGGGGVGG